MSTNAADRLSDFYINVSNNSDGSFAQECAYESEPFRSAETRVYKCENDTYGQFVWIGFQETNTEFLQLCQVQVQGGTLVFFFNKTLFINGSNSYKKAMLKNSILWL